MPRRLQTYDDYGLAVDQVYRSRQACCYLSIANLTRFVLRL
jgi:hypothetical protein